MQVQYCFDRIHSVPDLERRLADLGRAVGSRTLELLCLREKNGRRETRLNGVLLFCHTTVWKALFGKPADLLEKDGDKDDLCACAGAGCRAAPPALTRPARAVLISDRDLVVNRYISLTSEVDTLNCGAFVAGILEGVLCDCGFVRRLVSCCVRVRVGSTARLRCPPSPVDPQPATVTAHAVPTKGTTMLIKFDLSRLPPEALEGK